MGDLAKCKGCGRTIRFVPTEKGKLMPLDPDPEGSSVGIARLGKARVVLKDGRAHVLRDDEPWDGDLFMPHRATCSASSVQFGQGLRRAVDRILAREGLD